MPLSPPIGPLIAAARWAGGLVTRKLFLSTYHRSHELWAQRHRLGAHCKSYYGHLEHSLYLAQLTDPEPRTSMIAIRATGEDIARPSLIFEAESDVVRFQEQVTMVNVNQKAIVWTMTSIPSLCINELGRGVAGIMGLDRFGPHRGRWRKRLREPHH